MALPFGPIDLTFDLSDYILPETTITLSVGSMDLTEYLLGYSISGGRGRSITGSVTLKDWDGRIANLVASFNASNGNVKGHAMTNTVTFNLTVSQGEVSTNYPTLIPGDPSWDNEGTLTWAFSDMTPLASLDNQSTPNIVYAEGDRENSATAISAIDGLIVPGITTSFSHYDINVFRMNNQNVLAALDELQSPRQAYRKFEGSNMNLEALSPGSFSTLIVERKHIPEGGCTVSYDTSGLKTHFKYIKNNPLESTLGTSSCTGALGEESPCVGRVVEVTFSRPVQYVTVFTENTHGSIGEGVFYDEGNTPLNEDPETIFFGTAAGPKATRWLGTYTPDFEWGVDAHAYVPSWSTIAIGANYGEDTAPTSFEVEEHVSVAEALYGVRPEYKDLSSELLLNESDATAMLNAIAEEVKWSIKRIDINTPFLFSEREGEFLGVTHYGHGLASKNCLLDGWSHNFSYEGGWNNNYNLRYEV